MKVFQTCNNAQKSALIAPLVPTFAHIALDPLGNYVVQCTIEYSDRSVAAQIIATYFHDQLLRMSCDKFASNVVEKIIRCCGNVPSVHRLLLDELIYNPASLQEMACDGYGNFVLQSLIDALTNTHEIKKVCDRLKNVLLLTPYASKIEAKLKIKRGLIASPSEHALCTMPYQQQNFYQQYNNNNNAHNNSNKNNVIYNSISANTNSNNANSCNSNSYVMMMMSHCGKNTNEAVSHNAMQPYYRNNSMQTSHKPRMHFTIDAGAARANALEDAQGLRSGYETMMYAQQRQH
uniref:Pumilio 1 n=1 Tax=Lygus hesperus TaxID=30085 RepID=A0A0A9VZ41_LYGHE